MTEDKERLFNLLVPFTIKDAPMMQEGEMMDEENETLTIEGFANWYGEDVDTEGNGVCCDLVGDAVVPTGIDLSVYKGNPQILWQHDRECSIGKANKVVRKKQGLFVNATIYKGAMEEEDWFRLKNGLVTKFSIGFRTLAGEYREINKQNVFFITKSLLLEISIVTIPCNADSGFTIVKALEDGSFTSSYTEPHPTPADVIETTKEHTEDELIMKLPLRDLLSVEEVEHFKSLGLESELSTEKEISTRLYIDTAIASALEKADMPMGGDKMRKMVEDICRECIDKMMNEMGSGDMGSKGVPADSMETKTDPEAEAETEVETKAEAPPEEEIDAEIFKSLSVQVSELKALFV